MENPLTSSDEIVSNCRVVVSARTLPSAAAARIAQVLEHAVARRGRACVALAGGNTPRSVYRRLAQAHRLPREQLEIYFGDERAVPPNDPQNNYQMARETLLDAASLAPAQIHRIVAEGADLEAAADDYAARLPDRLDLIILGIGEDGHTASLFPGSPALNERARKVVVVDAPKPPRRRLTVTPPVIAAARVKIVLASGAEKSDAVARALEGSEDINGCPAQLARDGIWIMDHAAAAGLRSSDPTAGASRRRASAR
ncbi:MAG TPA: 6-phosphogluconolactonase [Burkholderiales bacterium]